MMQTCIEKYSSHFDGETIDLLQQQTNLIEIADKTRFSKKSKDRLDLLKPSHFHDENSFRTHMNRLKESIESSFTLDQNSRNILNTDIEKSRIKGYERIILAEQIRSSDLDSDTKKDLMFKISPISEKIADSPALEEEEKKFLLGELNKGDQTHKIESEQISQLCKANFLAAEEWAVKIRSTLYV